MLHQIQRCTAPCVGLDQPRRTIDEDVGARSCSCRARPTRCWRSCKRQMDAAAAALQFERAARMRDKIARLQQLQSRQFVESATAGDIDVVAARARTRPVAVNVVMIRGGRHVGDRTFFPRHADGVGDADGSCRRSWRSTTSSGPCRRRSSRRRRGRGCARRGADGAVGAQGRRSTTNPGGERRVWLTMATQNAELAIRQKLAQKATQEDRLAALQDALGLPAVGAADRVLRRVAHDGRGGGGVVRDLRQARDADVRISALQRHARHGGDDYAAMREALTRRCARIVAGEYPAPDLLVIDGGKGQVGVAAEVLAEQGLHQTPLIGIAKGPERKPGLEDIVFPEPRARAEPAARPSRAAPAAADPRRSAPLRDPGPPGATRPRRATRRRCRRSTASVPSGVRHCSRTSAV